MMKQDVMFSPKPSMTAPAETGRTSALLGSMTSTGMGNPVGLKPIGEVPTSMNCTGKAIAGWASSPNASA